MAVAVTFVVVGGCSLIYNPDNLGKNADAKSFQDAPPPDTEIIYPPNPADLSLMSIYPATIDEGRGSNNSRDALLVLRGSNFDGSDDLVVTLTPDDGGEAFTFDTTVGGDHNFIALSVVAPVDSTCNEGTMHTYDVAIDETGATAQTLPGALALICHDELMGSGSGGSGSVALDTGTLKAIYSQVKITGALTLSGTANAIIKSASTIEIDGVISANASGQTPGPGGKPGGGIAQVGMGAGGGGTALLSGGGAGFFGPGTAGSAGGAGGAMIGDTSISSYATNYASGGGGDGTLGAIGSVGGGGGGTIELTASGDITISAVSALGGGVNAATGAGAGGVIVVRPIGGTTHGMATLNVAGGTPGTVASAGRTRVDGQTDSTIVANYHGPGFGAVPLVSAGVQVATIPMTAQTSEVVNGSVISQDGFITAFSFDGGEDLTGKGYGLGMAMVPLTAGHNRVCVVVLGGDQNTDTATDCIEMAFLP